LTRITAWDPPHGFVDEQLRGPYRLWRHQHRFEADGAGTLSRDRVDYELRGTDTMQDIAQRLLVARDLTRIFRFRGERLAELFGQPST
jgi:ligand-binding SRPBCC domain-containing protein